MAATDITTLAAQEDSISISVFRAWPRKDDSAVPTPWLLTNFSCMSPWASKPVNILISSKHTLAHSTSQHLSESVRDAPYVPEKLRRKCEFSFAINGCAKSCP
eukprot:6196815-Pleurochrysis_carterae.AAC.5